MKVPILGCGPAGLVAAAAVEAAGHEPLIISRKVKSPMPGAQYLHKPVEGVTPNKEPDGMLTYKKIGTKEGYAERVYGDPNAPVSWDSFDDGEYPAWKISTTYDVLWNRYCDKVVEKKITRIYAIALCELYPIVISSVPAKIMCKGFTNCQFHSQRVWISDSAWSGCKENTIIYNGAAMKDDPRRESPYFSWYRTSNIFGFGSIEWARPAFAAWTGEKPTHTDCQCAPENMVKVGRFGKWDKHALVHNVWEEVLGHALLAL